jgi:thiol-disulfide isomerase/thioredoxin
MRIYSLATSAFLLAALLICPARAQDEKAAPPKSTPATKPGSDADKAWDEFQKASELPRPPESWQNGPPSQEELDKFKASEAERLTKAASQADAFQKRFPDHAKAEEARTREYQLLQVAAQLGSTNVLDRLDALDAARLKDPKLPDDDRFQIKASAINRRAMAKSSVDMAAALAELDKGTHVLLKEFPKRPEPYQMLLEVASNSSTDRARQLVKEITDSAAPDQIKDAARDLSAKLDRVGKPLTLKFAAVDGRSVDLAKLRGKVVLVDFWATWCGPCVRELPNVKAAYDKLHAKGFEIVGISFDKEKESLVGFVEQQKMPWPQYFDGKQWENDFGKQFGIQSIPTMWLVDKKGNLRDLDAVDDLAGKVEKLLAESP